MKILRVWSSTLAIATLAYGCDNPPEQSAPVGLGDLDASTAEGDGSTPAGELTSDAGTDGATAVVGIDAATPPPAFNAGPTYATVAAIGGSSTSISILDGQGKVLSDDFITTGSAKAGLTTALSGDVELPKHSGEAGILVIIDRFTTDVITRVRLSDAFIFPQVKTHTPAAQQTMTSYSSNPQDYIYVDATTAWVSRAEPNLDPMAAEIDRGTDLLRINPTTMERTTDRIDLSVANGVAMVADGAMTKQVPLYARPGRMVRFGNTVVVNTSRLAGDFSAVGDGVVALVDLPTKTAKAFAIPDLKNCGSADAIPRDSDSVLIGCSGDFTADDGGRATAGFVILGIANGSATVEHLWHAKDDPATTPLTGSVVALGGTLVGASANDYAGKGSDVFAILDLANGAKTVVLSETPGSGRFGTPAFDIDHKLLLLPDSSTDANKQPTSGIRRFQGNADGTFTELESTKVAVQSGLPARAVYPL